MMYNSFVNPFIACKTDIIISNNTLQCNVYTKGSVEEGDKSYFGILRK